MEIGEDMRFFENCGGKPLAKQPPGISDFAV
jgi:hypothetical protein